MGRGGKGDGEGVVSRMEGRWGGWEEEGRIGRTRRRYWRMGGEDREKKGVVDVGSGAKGMGLRRGGTGE